MGDVKRGGWMSEEMEDVGGGGGLFGQVDV